jgi:hypothetical protein
MSLRKAIESILKQIQAVDVMEVPVEGFRDGVVGRLQVALDASEGASPEECCLNKPMPKLGPGMYDTVTVPHDVVDPVHRRDPFLPKPILAELSGLRQPPRELMEEEANGMRLVRCSGGPFDGDNVPVSTQMPEGAYTSISGNRYKRTGESTLTFSPPLNPDV